MAELKRLGEHEARLGHRPLSGVHEQDDAVDHLEYALDLAAEVGVARGIDDVYFGVAIAHGGVFREYGYAPLALKVAGVHDPRLDLLVFAENARLLEHFIDQCGLAVVNVGDYRDVSQLIQMYHLLFIHKPEFYHPVKHIARPPEQFFRTNANRTRPVGDGPPPTSPRSASPCRGGASPAQTLYYCQPHVAAPAL